MHIMSENSSRIGQLDFIVIGDEKCGAAWVSEMFRQHHHVFIPEQKELHYFNRKCGESRIGKLQLQQTGTVLYRFFNDEAAK